MLSLSVVVLQENGNQSTERSAAPFFCRYPNDDPSYLKDTWSNLPIAALFLLAWNWIQSR